MTPAEGLVLRVDGVPQSHVRVEETVEATLGQNDPLDPGYPAITDTHVIYDDIAPGVHHLELVAPDCASSTDQVVLAGEQLQLSGRLALTKDWLRGTATLPSGFTAALGGYLAWRPAYVYPSNATAYSYGATEGGGMLSIGYETRHVVFLLDQMFVGGGGSMNASGGTTPVAPTAEGAPTGSTFVWGTALRVGGRVAYRDVALAAGAGIGVDLVENQGLPTNVAAWQGIGGHFTMPFWATVTYKPTCSWGVRVTGTYELHPTAMSETAPMLMAGMIWQPSPACSEAPHLDAR